MEPESPKSETVNFPEGFENWSKDRQRNFSEVTKLGSSISALDRNKEIIHIGDLVQWNEGNIMRQGKISSFSEIDKSVSMEDENGITRVPLANVELAKEIKLESEPVEAAPDKQEDEPKTSIFNEDSMPESGMLEPDNHPVEDMAELINQKSETEQIITAEEPEKEIAPEIKPEPEPVVQKENVPEDQSAPEKSLQEEWEEFVELRNDLAKTKALKNNFSVDSGISVEDLKLKYAENKERAAGLVRKNAHEKLGFGEGPLTREQEERLNDFIFNELVVKENDAYLEALKANRKETWKDKTKEVLRTVVGLKAVSWYLKQNQWTKVAVNTTLFGTAVGIGTFVGGGAALTAMGAVAYRGARGVSSVFGSGSGAALDKKYFKQTEKVDEEEKEEIEKIKNDQTLSLEEKTKKFTKAKDKYDKERGRITKRKAAMMIGGGILAGSAAGGILHMAYSGTGGGISKALEQTNRPKVGTQDQFKGENLQQFLGRRGTTNFGPKPNIDDLGKTAEKSFNSSLQSVKPLEQTEIEPTLEQTLPTETPEISTEKLFEHPENLKHIKMEGNNNSIWKAIEEGFKENKQFNDLNQAQKDNVIAFFTGKAVKNPLKYGFISDSDFGVKVEPNQEIDLSKLLNDSEEIKKILKGATELTKNEQQNILESRAQLATYLHDNPDVKLTSDKVTDILNTKPETEIETENIEVPEPPEILATEPKVETALAEQGEETLVPEALSLETHPEILESGEPVKSFEPIELPKAQTEVPTVPAKMNLDEIINKREEIEKEIRELVNNKDLSGEEFNRRMEEINIKSGQLGKQFDEMPKTAPEPPIVPEPMPEIKNLQQNIENEIAEARQRLEILEGGRGRGGIRTMMGDVSAGQNTETAVANGINNIYGKSGFLGFGKVAGINSEDWVKMAGLLSKKVVEYYTGDSAKSGLAADVVEELSKSGRHNAFLKQMAGLMEQTKGAVKPFENNENMGQFMRRLVGYSLKAQAQNLAKAA